MNHDPDIHHRRSIRLRNFDYSRPGYYFITIVVHGRRRLLGEVRGGKMLLTPTGEMVRKVWEGLPERFPGIAMDEFAVMPNHFHGIVVIEPPNDPNANVGAPFMAPASGRDNVPGGAMNRAPTLGEVVRRFKAGATRVIHGSGFSRFSWQRNYHEHVICGEASLAALRNHVRHNPLVWDDDPENPKNPASKGRRDDAALAFGPANR